MRASCQCGDLSVMLDGQPEAVVACHGIACQRRTGSVFGVLASYPDRRVRIDGAATRFARTGASGGEFETLFCATGDPSFPPPVRSIWESTMHGRVSISSAGQHCPRGRSG